jgi:hypothetical protein
MRRRPENDPASVSRSTDEGLSPSSIAARAAYLLPAGTSGSVNAGSVGGHAMTCDPRLGGWIGAAPPIQRPRLLLT